MLKHQYTHWTLLMSLELRFGKQTNQLFKCRETDRVIPWRTLPTQQTWLYKENIPIRNDTPKIKMAAEQIKRNFRLFSISYFVDMNSHQLYNLICICTAETNNWKRKKKQTNPVLYGSVLNNTCTCPFCSFIFCLICHESLCSHGTGGEHKTIVTHFPDHKRTALLASITHKSPTFLENFGRWRKITWKAPWLYGMQRNILLYNFSTIYTVDHFKVCSLKLK